MNGGHAWWKVWVPGLVLLSVMVVGVTGNVMRGNYMALLLLGGALLAAGIMVLASQFRARNPSHQTVIVRDDALRCFIPKQ